MNESLPPQRREFQRQIENDYSALRGREGEA